MRPIVTDNELIARVIWPIGLTESVIRVILARVRRFIDMDMTIGRRAGTIAADTLCGLPLEAFLAEEPFVVHTRGSCAIPFFMERFPLLPKPELIVYPPSFRFTGPVRPEDVDGYHGKDLSALGIDHGTVIDDLPSFAIYAPGCRIIGPNDPF